MDIITKSQLLKLNIGQFPFQMVVHLLNRLFFDESALLKLTMRRASYNLGDVCLVFGKPSGWQRSTYKVFQDAAESLRFARRQIKFVSETEAFFREYLKSGESLGVSFHSSMTSNAQIVQKDNAIVIADCGGYTVDIDAYQIVGLDEDKNSVTQVSPAGILPLSKRTIVGFFKKASIDSIVNELRSFIKRLPTKPTTPCLSLGRNLISHSVNMKFGMNLKWSFGETILTSTSKPVATGAVDMAANPNIVESRLLKSSYSILTKFPWSEKEGPQTICLNVDFRNKIPDHSDLRKKKGYFYMRCSLELHLDGDSLIFLIKTKDKNGNHYLVEIDDLGATISSVILTGDCAQTRQERSSNISNWTIADKTRFASMYGNHVKKSSQNIGINTSPDDASPQACNSVNSVTPTPSLVDPFEKLEYDSVNLNLLLDQHHISSEELEDPFSSTCPRPKSDLYRPARRPRRGIKSKKAPTLETPQVPRPTTLDNIGLPINDRSRSIDELSSSVLPLPSPVVPEDAIDSCATSKDLLHNPSTILMNLLSWRSVLIPLQDVYFILFIFTVVLRAWLYLIFTNTLEVLTRKGKALYTLPID
ncbi:hypothetical protein BOTNAR_0036g00300 [Botryotinia narcissicola]|uniref:Uncharacterized protein n=1 Tax=Botryotinia narcissicola TaxID=278944 RepID=A0A4Z1JEY7_9HELO|nr:hypothetical protein BOTNAR_0036g00300 [Botryotinia narcissicola]